MPEKVLKKIQESLFEEFFQQININWLNEHYPPHHNNQNLFCNELHKYHHAPHQLALFGRVTVPNALCRWSATNGADYPEPCPPYHNFGQ